MVLLSEEAHEKARFGLFGYNANLDARQVYGLMERTIFSEINLDAPDRTPRSCVSYGILLQYV